MNTTQQQFPGMVHAVWHCPRPAAPVCIKIVLLALALAGCGDTGSLIYGDNSSGASLRFQSSEFGSFAAMSLWRTAIGEEYGAVPYPHLLATPFSGSELLLMTGGEEDDVGVQARVVYCFSDTPVAVSLGGEWGAHPLGAGHSFLVGLLASPVTVTYERIDRAALQARRVGLITSPGFARIGTDDMTAIQIWHDLDLKDWGAKYSLCIPLTDRHSASSRFQLLWDLGWGQEDGTLSAGAAVTIGNLAFLARRRYEPWDGWELSLDWRF